MWQVRHTILSRSRANPCVGLGKSHPQFFLEAVPTRVLGSARAIPIPVRGNRDEDAIP